MVATRDLGSSRVWRGGTNGGRERTRKVTLAEVDVALDAPVGKGDLLEVRPTDDPSQFLTAHADRDAAGGETITCRTPRPMTPGCPCGSFARSRRSTTRRARPAPTSRAARVHVRVVARLGKPFVVELSCADGSAAPPAPWVRWSRPHVPAA